MRKISKKRVAIALVLLSALATMPVLTSCGSKPSHATLVDEQPHIFPDYTGTTIPAGIAPLDFNVVGDSMQSVFVTVRGCSLTLLVDYFKPYFKYWLTRLNITFIFG